ncbi:MAG: TCR/Tet family MFS transporter [Anaerolineae bacterium]|nr:TCR/Tet family MFS transporter [Anaerolineae bacterium]
MTNRKPALGFIFVTLLLDILGLGLIIPVLPKLIESFSNNDIQAAASTYGILIAIFALMQFLFSPILGGLSDRFGRRPVILISLLGSGLDYLLLAFAPSLAWLFVGRIIAGITASNITTVTAYIADVSPPEKRAQNFGIVGAAFGLGFIVGPLIGGLLGNVGLRVPFLVVAGITLLNWLYGFFVLPESLPPENRRKFELSKANPFGSFAGLQRYPMVFRLTIASVFTFLAQNVLQSVWVLYTQYRYGWGTDQVGISLALVGLSAGLVQGVFVGRIVKRIGERNAVRIGLLVSVVSFILYGLAWEGWMFFVIPLISALGGVSGPSSQSIISKSVPANEQGTVQGALSSLNALTGIAGPIMGTAVFSYFIGSSAPFQLPGAPFFLASLLIAIGWLLIVDAFRRLPE